MTVLFALFAICLAAAGSYLAGIGVVYGGRGDWAVAAFALPLGALVGYGAYLFARVAWRVGRESRGLTADERNRRRRAARGAAAFALAQAVFALGMPTAVPMGVRVLSAIGACIVVPLLLAVAFEPPRRDR